MIAAVATTLECRTRPAPRPEPLDLAGSVERRPGIDVDAYLRLYRHVGADHLWFSRLYMSREELAAILASPLTEVHAYRLDDRDEGILELDFTQDGACEIKYFGVARDLQGTGAARRLMNVALDRAFAHEGVRRVWLHTNTIDHPRALDFYRRTGFQPVAQEIEIAPDPRLNGALPRETAPHVPIFE
ncbi:Acetyltransferase (GNAT) family protein [Aureimonas jatrophae]|uniref:Acetyltransferase (GNAT) family protein n=2 Tax=Aureimonas jatrophae TaxID=1166073 RepID=A0A1H0K2W0_9HYPH|nr:Acetyltransferase (GNAT) family protein [Aureimonas jatrophae]